MPPQENFLKFKNLEALKCHFWCSNITFSVKNLRYFLAAPSVFRSSELSILHFVSFYENLTKISQHESKSGFFLSRSHVGRDS